MTLRARAFTLVELLVALTLIALLSAAIGAFTWDLRAQRASLRDASEDRRVAGALFERLEEALATCIAIDRQGEPGLRGTPIELRIVHRATGLAADDAIARLGDQQTAFVRFDEEGERLVGGADAEEPSPISARVERLRLRYHDGESWTDSFDSAEMGHLPAAVEVAVWFAPPGGPQPPETTPVEIEEGGLPIPTPEEAMAQPERVWPEPDRLRIIAVPGGGREQ